MNSKVFILEARTAREVREQISRTLKDYVHLFPESRDARILLKPNLNSNMNALTGNTTDLRIIIAVIDFLKKCGYHNLIVGDGTSSGFYRNKINVAKRLKIDKVVEGIKSMRDSGLNVHSTFIFGLPGETKETIDKSIEFAQRLNSTTVQFSTVIPYPGTTLYEYLKEQDYLLTKNWEEYLPMYPIFEYPNLSAKEMGHAVKKAYRKYYFRPGYLKTGTKQLFSRPGTVISNIIKLVKFSFLEG